MKLILEEVAPYYLDTSGKELTDEQIRYFQDSVVRDEQGRLKICYHGTQSDFNEFSYAFLGKNATDEGKGFYFTDLEDFVDKYAGYEEGEDGRPRRGGRVIYAYLNITKPLSLERLTITKSQLIKFLKQIDKTGEDLLSNWGDVSTEGYENVIRKAADGEYIFADNDVDLIHSLYNSISSGSDYLQDFYDKLKKTLGYDGIVQDWKTADSGSSGAKGEVGTFYIVFDSNQVKYIDNLTPTSSRNMSEAFQKLANALITPSAYDIAAKLKNSGKAYRILYDANIDRYMIGDSYDVIHSDMLQKAYDYGYYHNMEDFIEEHGSIYNYIEIGQDGYYDNPDGEDEDAPVGDIDPYLIYMVFAPSSEIDDVKAQISDGYDKIYVYDFGYILTRGSDLEDCNLYKVLGTPNKILTQSPGWLDNLTESITENVDKQKQLDIVLKANPANDDYHTWIRTIDDIKTFEEALNDPEWDYDEYNPDYVREDALEALALGNIRVYSSYPIKKGIFVTPSRMEAETYAGNVKVYEKVVDINDVAWIDITQGQYTGV